MKLLFLIVAIALASVYAQLPIGSVYLGRGFDVVRGTLRPTTLGEVSFTVGRARVFVPDFDDDVDSVPINVAEASFIIRQLDTASSFLRESSADFKVGINAFGNDSVGYKVAFQGGATFRKFFQTAVNGSLRYYSSNVTIAKINMQILSGHVSRSFLARAEQLPTVYDATTKPVFLNFIDVFGTHYIRKASLGGRRIFYSLMNNTQFTNLTSRSVDVYATLTILFRNSVNYTGQPVRTQATNAANETGVQTYVFSYGGDTNTLSADNDFSGWAGSLDRFPVPVDCEVSHYIDLIPAASRNAMKEALARYHLENLLEPPSGADQNSLISGISDRYYGYTVNIVSRNACDQNPSAPGCSLDPADVDPVVNSEDSASALSLSVFAVLAALVALLF